MSQKFVILLFGFIFLVTGLLWTGVIVKRGQRHFFHAQSGFSFKTQSMEETLEDQKKIEVHTAPRLFNKTLSLLFWGTVGIEMLCALFYLLAGVSLLWGYRLSRAWVLLAAFFDLLSKVFIITYHQKVLIPFNEAFGPNDIMANYFYPSDLWLNRISNFFTGLIFIEPEFLAWGIFYGIYLCVLFYYFTRPDVIKLFAHKQG